MGRRWAGIVFPVVLVAASSVTLASTVAGASEHVAVAAAINGRSVGRIDANDPLRLDPDREALIQLRVDNRGDEEVVVRSVRLDGKVMGLTFFTYTTRVDLRLPPGESGRRTFTLDVSDLGGQANGLIPSRLMLLDEQREVVATRGGFPVDVRGSLSSAYGLFGLIVAATTAVLLAAALVRLASHRLPANRWMRGARFGAPGVGTGMTLTFTLSTLRVLAPNADTWLPLVAVGGVAGFLFGFFFTPGPDEDGRPAEVGTVASAAPTVPMPDSSAVTIET